MEFVLFIIGVLVIIDIYSRLNHLRIREFVLDYVLLLLNRYEKILLDKKILSQTDIMNTRDLAGEDLNEKINSLNDFLFKQKFDFEIENKKLILKVDEKIMKFVELFKEKFKEILDLDLEVKKVENQKQVKQDKQD